MEAGGRMERSEELGKVGGRDGVPHFGRLDVERSHKSVLVSECAFPLSIDEHNS